MNCLDLLLYVTNGVVKLDPLILRLGREAVHLNFDLFGFFLEVLAAHVQVARLELQGLVAVDDVKDLVELFRLILDLLEVRLVNEDGLQSLLDACILQLQYLQLFFLAQLLCLELSLQVTLLLHLLARYLLLLHVFL